MDPVYFIKMFLRGGFHSAVSETLALIVYSFQGDRQKIKKSDGGMLTLYV